MTTFFYMVEVHFNGYNPPLVGLLNAVSVSNVVSTTFVRAVPAPSFTPHPRYGRQAIQLLRGMVAQERGEITLPFPVIQINTIKWFLKEGVTAKRA